MSTFSATFYRSICAVKLYAVGLDGHMFYLSRVVLLQRLGLARIMEPIRAELLSAVPVQRLLEPVQWIRARDESASVLRIQHASEAYCVTPPKIRHSIFITVSEKLNFSTRQMRLEHLQAD